MIEETATVIKADSEKVWLSVEKQSACGACSVKTGCGTSVLSGVFNRQPAQIIVPNTINAAVGDHVIVGLPETAVLKGSMLVYFYPILGLLAGALIGQFIAGLFTHSTELYSIVFGILGLLGGSRFASYSLTRGRNLKNYQPVLLKVL